MYWRGGDACCWLLLNKRSTGRGASCVISGSAGGRKAGALACSCTGLARLGTQWVAARLDIRRLDSGADGTRARIGRAARHSARRGRRRDRPRRFAWCRCPVSYSCSMKEDEPSSKTSKLYYPLSRSFSTRIVETEDEANTKRWIVNSLMGLGAVLVGMA
jgi:hypothetical protein